MVAFNQPRGLFGASRNIMPGDQPMLPQPTLGAGPVGMGMPQPVPQMAQSQPNLTGERLFALGGILQGDQNAAGNFHQMQQQRAMMAQKAQQDALGKLAERAEWKWRTDYENANRAPPNNDTVQDYEFIRGRLGEEAGNAYLRRQADPDVTVPLPNGQVYIGPRSGMAAAMGAQPAGGAAPARPVGGLTPIQGGPTPRASGGF